MKLRIQPGKLRGTVRAISAKSVLHRQIICAMLADVPTEIRYRGLSEDIEATLRCVRALGCGVEAETERLRLTPGSVPAETVPVLDCGECGSTARFLLPVAAALRVEFAMTGAGRLPERPMADLCRAIEAHGCRCSGDRLPLTVRGRLTGGSFTLPGNVSSQYISALLLAAPRLDGCEIRIEGGLSSAGYVDITLRVLERFGIRTERTAQGWYVPGGQTVKSPGTLEAEGDWSNAAFWLCAGALSGESVTVTGLDPDSAQGDRAVRAVLERFRQPGDVEVDVDAIPDLLPVLAVTACARAGETRFVNGARLRLKESDRLESTSRLIKSLGGRAEAEADSLTVLGDGLRGGEADACGDHRIAMSAAVASILCTQPVILTGGEAVNKSYPAFFSDFKALGGQIERI